ncbi:MAG: hypothetical protein J1F28_03895 [Oscillospiraceae bacterium]|nr:hypothetical protein [Oscillospiraceae bacterium]
MKTNPTKIFASVLALFAAVCSSGCNIVVDDGSLPDINDIIMNENSSSSETVDSDSSAVNSSSTAESSSEESPDSSSESQSSSSETQNPAKGNGELSGGLVIFDDGSTFSLYGGGKTVGQDYAKQLNKFKELLGDVKVYSLVSPTSGSFYLPNEYKKYMASEKDNIDNINSYLSGVTPVDVYSVFEKHKSEYIFFRTDHHWQPLGAYYAAQEFAKVAGVSFTPLSEYETVTREGFVGALYHYSNEDSRIKNHPDTFTYYIPKNSYNVVKYDTQMQTVLNGNVKLPATIDLYDPSEWYLIFGLDNDIKHVTTDCKNGRKLMIIKDSYGNAFVPYLTSSFEEIIVIDMRNKVNAVEIAKNYGITDLVFVMNTFSATGSTNESKLKELY